MNTKIYPSTMTVFRKDYTTKRDYIKEYRDLCQHYDYKTRVFGGWRFFETAEQLRIWKQQR